MRTIQLFLASSSELKADREQFELFISRRNNQSVPKQVYLKLIIWEDFLDAMSRTRLQDEYNQAIKACDIFVMLFCTKVGMYTEEEFNTAFGQFQATQKPLIYTYFKDATISLSAINEDDLTSLLAFKKRLKALGHFHTPYTTTESLLLHFGQQLDKLADKGFIPLNRLAVASTSGVSQHHSGTGDNIGRDQTKIGRQIIMGPGSVYHENKGKG
jgi:hypothetical protein